MKAIVHGIFSTPIYISKLTREFTDEELKFVDKTKLDVYQNQGNTTSNNTYLLNTKPFNNLKEELNKILKDYFDKVVSPSNDIESYITQSWLNYTETNQYHHKHVHENSLVSGIIYLNADKKNDKIKFFKERYSTIKPGVKNYNIFNSDNWFFPVETRDIILFPSSLSHMVETKQGKNTRISLSFNTFIRGMVGKEREITRLKID
tara:strand:- start:175 stop:789 length:615 start_codon:yes stop_codon:yes gene_type:complete